MGDERGYDCVRGCGYDRDERGGSGAVRRVAKGDVEPRVEGRVGKGVGEHLVDVSVERNVSIAGDAHDDKEGLVGLHWVLP